MKPLHSYLIKPKNNRYDNIKKIGDEELILNTEFSNHLFVSRSAIVLETPSLFESNIEKGDEVIVHHNIFRRWNDVKGNERNSKDYFKDDKYFCYPDQIFLYKKDNNWNAADGYCFVKPLKNDNEYSIDKEKSLQGIIKYKDNSDFINIGDKVGFTPWSEYEFIINEERLYRVMTKEISIKYEREKKEAEYNPSWL
jgi:hypothetical protein